MGFHENFLENFLLVFDYKIEEDHVPEETGGFDEENFILPRVEVRDEYVMEIEYGRIYDEDTNTTIVEFINLNKEVGW